MPYDKYEEIRKIKEQLQHRQGLAEMEKQRERVRSRNTDLSNRQADALARRSGNEVIEEMIKEGKIGSSLDWLIPDHP